MGVGVAKGENRIIDAVRLAVNSPLLDTTIEGATGVILNIVGGPDLTLDEAKKAAGLIHGVVDYSANIIFGACIDENIQEEVEVTVIATGFPSAEEVMEATTRKGNYIPPVQAYNAPQQAYNAPQSPYMAPAQPVQPVEATPVAEPYREPAYESEPVKPEFKEEESSSDKKLPPFVQRLLGRK